MTTTEKRQKLQAKLTQLLKEWEENKDYFTGLEIDDLQAKIAKLK